MFCQQLSFLSKEEAQHLELQSLHKKYEALRKSHFARLAALKKEQDDLKRDLELLKAAICKSQNVQSELFLL